ncbi:MORC family CW-type zinc finger protein 3-like isoform X2 [Patella vulgata]|uniref:MORC family CW-type zinc finger protein 3-like isoform X2 n=1 Tax=Patella vulgata TaxID=6465 RepID=UPI0024A7D208|nr:MORC family CW-type zinc finger protein 3-like isoform X2 [Patella vulgata]
MDARHIERSRVSPSFLHSNSTNHIWVFSAIAELIDNAYDPDVNAKGLWIDKEELGLSKKTCLTITDNGSGLAPDKLLKMLSFGFCEKHVYEGKSQHQPIGHYGNGFKSGSMRIAKDVLVFTRHLKEMSVGMLSQNYLNQIKAETVVIPMVTWNILNKKRSNSTETVSNLREITKYSLFNSEERLLKEFELLAEHKTGTRLILYNLVVNNIGQLELDFESDPTDILNPQTLEIDTTSVYRPIQEAKSKYETSLKEYCSILFLKPRMKIFLRGNKVKTKLMTRSLSQTLYDTYNPQWLDKPIKITYGFNCSEGGYEDYGIMMYHKNRLIKAFKKVGYQKQANDLGVGVVGVVEVNFLQPIHNKQDFEQNERYNTFITALATKTNDYWNEKMNQSTSASQGALPDWLWAQCDNCLKWRRLPDGINRQLPDKWYCYMNADASHNRCDIDEEPENEDESIRPNQKTFKEVQKRKSKVEEELAKEALKAREEKLQEMYTAVVSSQDTEKRERELLQKKLEETERKLALADKKLEEADLKLPINLIPELPMVVNKTTASNSPAEKSTPSSKGHSEANKRKVGEISTEIISKRICKSKNEPNSTDKVLAEIDEALEGCSSTPNKKGNAPSLSAEVLRLKTELQRTEAKLKDTYITLENTNKKLEDSEQKLVQQELSLKSFENKMKYSETKLQTAEDSLRMSETIAKNRELEFADAQKKFEYSEKHLGHIQTTLKTTQTSLQDKESQLKLSEKELEQTQALLRDKQTTLQTTQTSLQDKVKRLKISEKQLEQTQTMLRDNQTTLLTTQKSLQDKESQLKLSEKKLEQTQTLLRDNQTTLQITQTSLQDKESQLKLSEKKLEQTQMMLRNNQTALQTTQTSLQDKESQLKLSEKKLEQTQALLRDKQTTLQITQTSLKDKESRLNLSEKKLEQTQTMVRDNQTALQTTQTLLKDKESRLKLSEKNLEETQTLLRNNQTTLQTTQNKLHNVEKNLGDEKHNLESTETRLQGLQTNIYRLLSILVPDVELGEVSDVDNIVIDMIDVNQEIE